MSDVPSSKEECVWYSHGSVAPDYWKKKICPSCQSCWVTLEYELPREFLEGEWDNVKAFRFRKVKVYRMHKTTTKNPDDWWIGKHKNVYVWYELVNGYAVGFNENPSVGWAFPVVKMPANRRFINPLEG